jgi:hypothetical protein
MSLIPKFNDDIDILKFDKVRNKNQIDLSDYSDSEDEDSSEHINNNYETDNQHMLAKYKMSIELAKELHVIMDNLYIYSVNYKSLQDSIYVCSFYLMVIFFLRPSSILKMKKVFTFNFNCFKLI